MGPGNSWNENHIETGKAELLVLHEPEGGEIRITADEAYSMAKAYNGRSTNECEVVETKYLEANNERFAACEARVLELESENDSLKEEVFNLRGALHDHEKMIEQAEAKLDQARKGLKQISGLSSAIAVDIAKQALTALDKQGE